MNTRFGAAAVVLLAALSIVGLPQLTELLCACAGLPPDAVADRVEAAVISASEGRLRDDMAILALGATPMLPAPGARSTEDIDG